MGLKTKVLAWMATLSSQMNALDVNDEEIYQLVKKLGDKQEFRVTTKPIKGSANALTVVYCPCGRNHHLAHSREGFDEEDPLQ